MDSIPREIWSASPAESSAGCRRWKVPDRRYAPHRLLQQLRGRTERQMELRGASLLWAADVAGTGASGSALKREHLRLLPESLCIVQEEPRQRVSQQPAPGGSRAAAHMLESSEGSCFSDPGPS